MLENEVDPPPEEPEATPRPLIPCPITGCASEMRRRDHLRRHLKNVHLVEDPESLLPPPKKPAVSSKSKSSRPKPGELPHPCPVADCGAVLSKRVHLYRHLRGVHKMEPEKVDKGDQVTKRGTVRCPVTKTDEGDGQCFLCGEIGGKESKLVEEFIQEVESGFGGKLWTCDRCQERVTKVISRKKEVTEVEREVNKLQVKLLEELRRLKGKLRTYWLELRGIGEEAKDESLKKAISSVTRRLEEFQEETKTRFFEGEVKPRSPRRRPPRGGKPKRKIEAISSSSTSPPLPVLSDIRSIAKNPDKIEASTISSAPVLSEDIVVKMERVSDSEEMEAGEDNNFEDFEAMEPEISLPRSPMPNLDNDDTDQKLGETAKPLESDPEQDQEDDEDWLADDLDLEGNSNSSYSEEESEEEPFSSEEDTKKEKKSKEPKLVKTPKPAKRKNPESPSSSKSPKSSKKRKSSLSISEPDTGSWPPLKRQLYKETSRCLNYRNKLLKQQESRSSPLPLDPRLHHITQYNPESDTFTIGPVQLLIFEATPSSPPYLQCSLCGFTCQHSSTLNRSPGNQMKLHIQIKHLAIFQCHLCSAVLGSYKRYTDHLNGHQGRYLCSFCGKALYSDESLKAHRWKKHMSPEEIQQALNSGEKDPRRQPPVQKSSLQCPTCGKSFTQSGALKLHERMQHSGEPLEKQVCCNCGATFKHKVNLEYHQKYSCFLPGQKPPPRLQCPVEGCGKLLKNKILLKRHLDALHSTAAVERPFKCDLCGAAFPTNVRLKRHQTSHSDARPWECRLGCGANYKLSKHRNRHEKICRGMGSNGPGVGTPRNKAGVKVEREQSF